MVTAEVTINTTTKAMKIGIVGIIEAATTGIVATKSAVTRSMGSVGTDADIAVTTIMTTSSCMPGMTNTEEIFPPDSPIGTACLLGWSGNWK